jgi:hypothetical protein
VHWPTGPTLGADRRRTRDVGALGPAADDGPGTLALRAHLVLGCAADETNTRAARQLRVTKQTVGKWRSRFLAKRLDGLLERVPTLAPSRRRSPPSWPPSL